MSWYHKRDPAQQRSLQNLLSMFHGHDYVIGRGPGQRCDAFDLGPARFSSFQVLRALLEREARVHPCTTTVIGAGQTVEEVLTHRLKLGATECLESFHAVESGSPGVDHRRAGGPPEREFRIVDGQYF